MSLVPVDILVGLNKIHRNKKMLMIMTPPDLGTETSAMTAQCKCFLTPQRDDSPPARSAECQSRRSDGPSLIIQRNFLQFVSLTMTQSQFLKKK